jgi:dihydroorotate dehydrogenase electron transfer subunit
MDRLDTSARVIKNERLSKDIFLLCLHTSQIANIALPGQFFMLKVSEGHDPLLRRPLSVHDALDETLYFLYKVVGNGTHILSRLTTKDEINVLGPLGRPFRLNKGMAIIVGGGMGVAPLFFLSRISGKEKIEKILIGARDIKELVRLDEFSSFANEIEISTDNGTYGHKGFVTELLLDHLSLRNPGSPPLTVYTCGPFPMMKTVHQICKKFHIPCQASLEAHMACGFGLCLGCAVKRKDGKGYLHVCKEGPVFDSSFLDWSI